MIHKENRALHNLCLRMGLGKALQLLSGSENELTKVRTLYRCRATGLRISITDTGIFINGHAVQFNDLDNPDELIGRVGSI